MTNIGTDVAIIETEVDLDELFAVVRAKLREVQQVGAALLHSAMDIGDALNLAEIQIIQRGGNWKRSLRENCFLSVRTAFVYQQLARRRKELEEAIERAGDLSIRAALRLISTPKKKVSNRNPPDEQETLEAHWARAAKAERTIFLDAIGVDGVLAAMSKAFGEELRNRVPAKSRKRPTLTLPPNTKLAASHLDQMHTVSGT